MTTNYPTVKELIDILATYPQDAPIHIWGDVDGSGSLWVGDNQQVLDYRGFLKKNIITITVDGVKDDRSIGEAT